MSNVKISELPIANDITPDDLLVVVDDPSGSAATKNLLMSTLTTSINDTLPVKDIVGSEYVNVVSTSGNYTISATGLQPSGDYSVVGHSHVVDDVTDFSVGVSGLLPVKDIVGGNNISVSSLDGEFTISATGLQPSGDYSVVGHTHLSTEILEAQPVYNTTQNTYYDTIQEAINAAATDDVIEVAAGTYVVDVTISINKPLTLRGPNYKLKGDDPNRGPEATLVYGALPNNSMIISTDSSNVTFEGFNVVIPDELLLASPVVNLSFGWFSYSEDNLVIRNNRWYGGLIPVYVYFRFANKTGVVIEGNYIDGGPSVNTVSSRGIYCSDAAAIIQDNVVLNFGIGIQHSQYTVPTPSFIRRNRISASAIGLYNNAHFRGGADVTYEYNSITVAPNDREGLKTLVFGASTNNVIFNGIQLTFMGVQNAQSDLPKPTVICSNNAVDMILNPAHKYNSVVLRGLFLNYNHPESIANVTNNSFVGWTVAARSNTDNGILANAINNWWGTETIDKVVLDIGPPSTLDTGVAVSGNINISPVLSGSNVGDGTLSFLRRLLLLGSDVEYDNSTSGLSATNVKAAIDELNNLLGNAATIVDAPATSSSSGVPGQIAYDNEYFYVCVATNTWLRTPIGTW